MDNFLEIHAKESFLWKNPEIPNIIKSWERVGDKFWFDDNSHHLLFNYLWDKFEIKPPCYDKDVMAEKEKTRLKEWGDYCQRHNIENLGYFEDIISPDLRGAYKLKESNEKYLWICSPIQSVKQYCLSSGYCDAANKYHKAYPIIAVPEKFAIKICTLKSF